MLGRKRIPETYLRGSVSQRRALLAGVADTDGTSANGQVAIDMMNSDLVRDVEQLARSLGYKASTNQVMAKIDGRPVRLCHRLQFRADQARSPFDMPRKTDRLPPQRPRPTRSSYNAVVKVERVASRPTRCITVDNESRLYLVGRGFVPTHNTARKAFLRLLEFFDNPRQFPELAALVAPGGIRRTNGQEAIQLVNGGSCEFIARSKGSGRGFTVDDLVMDEAQSLDDVAYAALLPTISASPSGNPQQIICGTPPGPHDTGEVFARLRADALSNRSTRTLWLEWSFDPGADPDDRAQWARANPALGTRLSMESVEDERAAADDATFARERGGVWAAGGTPPVIADATWRCLFDDSSRPVDEKGLALGLDSTPDGAATVIAVAGHRADGLVHVELVDQRAGSMWVTGRVAQLVDRHGMWGAVVDYASPARAFVDDLREAGVPVVVTGVPEATTACSTFLSAVNEGWLRHVGQPQLAAAVSVARKRSIGTEGLWAWGRAVSSSDISPTWAATLAVWGLTSGKLSPPKRRRTGKGVFRG